MTRIRFERGPMTSAAHLSSEDGSSAFVFCGIPGGKPQFQFSRDDKSATTIVGAPTINSHKEFVAFVNERFGGES